MIAYKSPKTRLALEDAKATISQIPSETHSESTSNSVDETEVT
jgi:hypothetical protein